jgi:hypothetical protein
MTAQAPAETQAKRGKQTRKGDFAQSVKDAICERIANGEPLRAICREDGMPSWVTVYDWINKDESFALRFARARDLGADAIAESTLEIADDATNDWMERLDKDDVPVGYQVNGDHIQRSKLRIETRLKLLAKWNPKKYGERLALAGDPSSPLVVQLVRYGDDQNP